MIRYINFMPMFAEALAAGRKTHTYRKAEKYTWLKDGDLFGITVPKLHGGYNIGTARVVSNEEGVLSMDSPSWHEHHGSFTISFFWDNEYGRRRLLRSDIEADGFNDVLEFYNIHKAFGNLSSDKVVPLRRIVFRYELQDFVATRYRLRQFIELSTSPNPVLF